MIFDPITYFEADSKPIPKRVGKVQTINVQTGEVTEERPLAFTLASPPPDVCQECAVDHAHDQPHNAQSLYYQMRFHAEHGRHPTWADAVAHCAPEVRAAWEAELRRRGAWTESEGRGR
jgi:hypothetical protein